MERDVIENINNSKKNPKEIKTNKKKHHNWKTK
jgi:hypothetical protein